MSAAVSQRAGGVSFSVRCVTKAAGDVSLKGCAPPPGTYDVKAEDLKGAASFDKSDRFKLVKAGE